MIVLSALQIWAGYEPSKIQVMGSSQDKRSIVTVEEHCNFGMAGFCNSRVLKFDRTSGSEEIIAGFSGDEIPDPTAMAVAKARESLREMNPSLSTSTFILHPVKSWPQEILNQGHTPDYLFPVSSVPCAYSMGRRELRVRHVFYENRLGFELWLVDHHRKRCMLWKRYFPPEEDSIRPIYYYLLEDVYELDGQPLVVLGKVYYQIEGDWGQSFVLISGAWDASVSEDQFRWQAWDGTAAPDVDPVLFERFRNAKMTVQRNGVVNRQGPRD